MVRILIIAIVSIFLNENFIQASSELPPQYYFCKNNIEQLNFDSKNSSVEINNMLAHLTDKKAMLDLFESALQKANAIRKDTFLKLTKLVVNTYPRESKKIVQDFIKTNSIGQSYFEHVFKFGNILTLKNHFPNITIPILKQTQTEWHLKEYISYISKDIDDPKLKNFLKKIHRKEKDEKINKKRYVFFHGQQWKWNFAADIFKKLWELKYNKKIGNDFQFLRFIDNNGSNVLSEQKKRINALEGKDNYSRRDERMIENYTPAPRLFMNYALFGNSKRQLASSFYYFTNNCDRSRDRNYISVKKLFDELDLSIFYKKYEKKFDELKALHQNAKTYGNMLLLSFSPEQLKKTVISANWNGNIKPVHINGSSCKDTKKIIDALESKNNNLYVSTDRFCQSSDSDGLEFCCILTHDCALNPNNGPKIYSFHAADEKPFKKYNELKEKIFEAIAKDISISNGV